MLNQPSGDMSVRSRFLMIPGSGWFPNGKDLMSIFGERLDVETSAERREIWV